jgi:hypothetical protein
VDLGSNNDVQGDVAHDSADSGNPLKVGAVATGHGTVTGVAEGDRTNLRANRDGVLLTMGHSPGGRCYTATIAAADGAQTNSAMLAVGGGTVIAITRIAISCSNANSVDTDVKVGFATASLPTPNSTGSLDILHEAKAIPPGGSIVIGDGSGVIGVGEDGEDLRYSCSAPTGGHVSISVTYFAIES